MTIKGKKRLRIALIVVAIVAVLLCGALAFAANFLFDFALNPNGSYTMGDMFQTGSVDGVTPSQPVENPSQAVLEWREYSAQAQEWFQAEGEPVQLEREGGQIRRGSWFGQEGHRYALVCHGYTSDSADMSPYARRFYDMGCSVLAPDALAHGESDGDYYGMGWLERGDVLAWIDSIIAQDSQAEILLFGVSMGGATVMMASGEALPDNVKCIVEDCGYSSVWDEFSLQLGNVFHLPAFPLLHAADLVCRVRAGYGFREASSVAQLEQATVPMLFIHGEEDTFVPYSMLEAVYNACASVEKEKLSVPGAGHGRAASTDPELYWSTVSAFVEKHMG